MNSTSTQNLQTSSVQPANPPVQQSIIQIGTMEALFGLAGAIILIGIAWGTLKTKVENVCESITEIKKKITDAVEPDLKDIRERFSTMEGKVDVMWRDKFAPSSSPRKLNDRGQKVLVESGVKEIIESKVEDIKKLLLERKPQTAYDAEQELLDIVLDLRKHCPDIETQLKDGAYKTGSDIDTVLLVAAFYVRDIIFPQIGFSSSDIDKKSA